MKFLKLIIGLLLLPACVGAAWAVGLVVRASGTADTVWAAVLAGAGCWLAIYLLLPKPMWVYVVGHELTHALWVWAMGGRVKKFKASSSGGHVVVTKTNFLIALAPYFFPFYAMMVVAVFVAGDWYWNWRPYVMWFHFLLGAAYSFHLTLTWHALKVQQTDITEHGCVFSAAIIFLGNAAILLFGLPLLASKVTVGTALHWWWTCTSRIVRLCCHPRLFLFSYAHVERLSPRAR